MRTAPELPDETNEQKETMRLLHHYALLEFLIDSPGRYMTFAQSQESAQPLSRSDRELEQILRLDVEAINASILELGRLAIVRSPEGKPYRTEQYQVAGCEGFDFMKLSWVFLGGKATQPTEYRIPVSIINLPKALKLV